MSGARLRFMAELAERATPRLEVVGFGPARFQPSGKYLPIRWPANLWFRQHTQNDDLHLFVYDDRVALRVHVDTFHGDRVRNTRALTVIRAAIEADLLGRLPPHRSINWRDAKGGNNQVCAVIRDGGVAAAKPADDAAWTCAVAEAWLEALHRHPIRDLREQLTSSSRG